MTRDCGVTVRYSSFRWRSLVEMRFNITDRGLHLTYKPDRIETTRLFASWPEPVHVRKVAECVRFYDGDLMTFRQEGGLAYRRHSDDLLLLMFLFAVFVCLLRDFCPLLLPSF